MQKQGFPYIKQMLGVGVVASKEWGESRAAQVMITLRDPGTEASHLSVDGNNHKKWGKITQKGGRKFVPVTSYKGKKKRMQDY